MPPALMASHCFIILDGAISPVCAGRALLPVLLACMPLGPRARPTHPHHSHPVLRGTLSVPLCLFLCSFLNATLTYCARQRGKAKEGGKGREQGRASSNEEQEERSEGAAAVRGIIRGQTSQAGLPTTTVSWQQSLARSSCCRRPPDRC